MTKKSELAIQNIFPIWVSFGEYNSIIEVFQEVYNELIERISNKEDLIVEITCFYNSFINAKNELEKKRFIKKILKLLKTKGLRLILIFDEFDNAKNILCLNDFQFLRELSNNPETKLALLTITRKTLQELEPDNGALSNFYQIFTDLRLRLFGTDDQGLYWDRVRSNGIEVSKSYTDLASYYCGSHPYLLDVFNHEVFNNISQNKIDLDQITLQVIKELNLKMLNEYESIVKLMIDEGIERQLMQMVVGPVYDITQRDVEKILKYGIVTKSLNGDYISFSEYFNQYLQIKSSEIDIWPLWSDVENEIRSLIKLNLFERFGDSWEEAYTKQNKQKGAEAFIQEKREMKLRNKKSFGDKASDHLVDYTYPMDMFDRFIAHDWSWFSVVFEKQKNDWKPVFEHLGRIRNPLAHNNPNFLSDSDKNIAEGYCKIILEKINKWKVKMI